jgi:hypothetical protein
MFSISLLYILPTLKHLVVHVHLTTLSESDTTSFKVVRFMNNGLK